MKFPETVDYWKLWRHHIIPEPFVFNEKVEETFFCSCSGPLEQRIYSSLCISIQSKNVFTERKSSLSKKKIGTYKIKTDFLVGVFDSSIVN